MQDYTDYTLFFTWPIALDLVLVWGLGLGLGLGGLGPGLTIFLKLEVGTKKLII